MNDHELLELAAKAAGIDLDEDCQNPRYRQAHEVLPEWVYWNPLSDDGDALRLADKLNMAVYFSESGKTAEAPDGPGPVWEETDYRRAIVRAAAEIGSQMK